MVDSPSLNADEVSACFANDWVRTIGKQRRAIMDRGPPGMFDEPLCKLPHVFAWKMIHSPSRTTNQNGFLERSVRSFKVAAKAIMTDGHMIAGQYVLTLASIARNHAHRSITGAPPAVAMAGRSDVLAGGAAAIWNSDP